MENQGDYKSYNDYVIRNGLTKNLDNAIDYLFDVDTELSLAARYIEIMLNDINSSSLDGNNSERIKYWKLGYKIINDCLDVY